MWTKCVEWSTKKLPKHSKILVKIVPDWIFRVYAFGDLRYQFLEMLAVDYLFQKLLLEIVLRFIALIWDRKGTKSFKTFKSFIFYPEKANLNIRDIIDSNRWDLLDAQFWFRNLQKKTGFREKDGVHWVRYRDINTRSLRYNSFYGIQSIYYFRIKSLIDG